MFPNVLVANISNESFDNINQIIYDYMYKLNLRPALVHKFYYIWSPRSTSIFKR